MNQIFMILKSDIDFMIYLMPLISNFIFDYEQYLYHFIPDNLKLKAKINLKNFPKDSKLKTLNS